ncbi:MAG TPA: right-handed parallel beta-helix repeat-containing protein [Planctomycetota bacterium]|jgi:hypothetical protein|nr:right-handed parallel beta-helix repeat-containing protein [Planctomycetota bacterium]
MSKNAAALALAGLSAGASVRANDTWVSAYAGSDVTGTGTFAYPWRTITYALTQGVSAGDKVHVYCGVYDAGHGETFPIAIPDGASLFAEEGFRPTILDAGHASDVVVLGSGSTLSGFTVTGSANGWWNGGAVRWTPASGITVENCAFTGNERGLHLWTGNANVLVRNCVFANNANDALSCFGSTGVTVLNCTFRGNLKGTIFDGSTATVRNSIVTLSGVAGIQNSTQNPSTLTLDHNDVFGNAVNYDPPSLAAGVGSMSSDPLFADPVAGDLHLLPASGCVNAGVADPLLAASDVDGDPRVAGSSVDLGADERDWPDLTFHGPGLIGTPFAFRLYGEPGSAWALFASPLPSPGAPTPFGTVYLDLSFAFFVASGACNASGGGSLSVVVPNDPSLVGGVAYFQELGFGPSGLALSAMRKAAVH